jgi:hypothetical protein
VPINKHVRVKLKFLRQEEQGKLILAEQPPALDKKQPLMLSVNKIKFVNSDIETCSILHRKKIKERRSKRTPSTSASV